MNDGLPKSNLLSQNSYINACWLLGYAAGRRVPSLTLRGFDAEPLETIEDELRFHEKLISKAINTPSE